MSDRPVGVITGGSRGIGRGIALELAKLGHDIAIAHYDFDDRGQPDESKALQTQKEAKALGAACEVLRMDVSSARDRTRLLELARTRFGRCNMLVNNAGVAPSKRLDLLEATEESFDRVMSINLKGPYFLTQAFANWMIEQRKQDPEGGYRIVNTGSISAYTSSPSRGEYCVSKAGIAMMTKLYADRLSEYDIGVFEVSPGIIETDMTSAVKGKYDKLIGEGLTPTRRWGMPADVAKVVGTIAEGKLDFSTGSVINVDGGFHLHRL
jgi:NAD(P)-dependent dehydrogenase (short-subunit alcohol dehydrogenase family)